MAERICLAHSLCPPWLAEPLRLPDNTFTHSPFNPRAFLQPVLNYGSFPIPELCMFGSVVSARHGQCWAGTCAGAAAGGGAGRALGAGCAEWPAERAIQVMQLLEHELGLAVGRAREVGMGQEEKGRKVGYVVVVAWMRE